MKVYGNLMAEIAKRGYTKKEVAESIELSRNALANKLNCKTSFKVEELETMHKKFFQDCEYVYLTELYERATR